MIQIQQQVYMAINLGPNIYEVISRLHHAGLYMHFIVLGV
jgi:hypothetical protein